MLVNSLHLQLRAHRLSRHGRLRPGLSPASTRFHYLSGSTRRNVDRVLSSKIKEKARNSCLGVAGE